MKKIAILVVVLAVAGGAGYLVITGNTGLYRSDVHIIKKKTERFFECVKFKEFKEAAAFHNAKDQKKANIPKMIEDLFKVPPEQLDIQEVQVLFGEVDSSGVLGKTKTRCIVQVLNANKQRKPEVVLYWKKEGGSWFLKLKSTLQRNPSMGG